MTDKSLPPSWAIERVREEYQRNVAGGSGPDIYASTQDILDRPRQFERVIAFARYIAAHEQPPIDPTILAAREWAHSYATEGNPQVMQFGWLEGKHDNKMVILAFLAGAAHQRRKTDDK